MLGMLLAVKIPIGRLEAMAADNVTADSSVGPAKLEKILFSCQIGSACRLCVL